LTPSALTKEQELRTTYGLEGNVHSGSVGDSLRRDCRVFGRVNRSLAVLGSNDDERVMIQVLFDQLGNYLSQGVVDEVQCLEELWGKI
jgi:hypothetical protein